jgi:hypothetical protein
VTSEEGLRSNLSFQCDAPSRLFHGDANQDQTYGADGSDFLLKRWYCAVLKSFPPHPTLSPRPYPNYYDYLSMDETNLVPNGYPQAASKVVPGVHY